MIWLLWYIYVHHPNRKYRSIFKNQSLMLIFHEWNFIFYLCNEWPISASEIEPFNIYIPYQILLIFDVGKASKCRKSSDKIL